MNNPEMQCMTREHLRQVHNIESECFAIPWSYDSFEEELENPLAIYLVAMVGGEVAGFAGMHHVVDEGNITNIAVRRQYRGQGIGGALVRGLCDIAAAKKIAKMTLEVRVGNHIAFRLYGRHGFTFAGIRKNYYVDTKEDAIVMWKEFGEVAQ
ncbi:MAG: ribosomal protein S18-alanine N-acetyltransferase [Clostridiales bacterium]|jgi:ribosomal-protein-alanine N-acetyltransferase|nr:ribosomal protein S18-alanine N-acetyltransferase [Clostridiales bacterium]